MGVTDLSAPKRGNRSKVIFVPRVAPVAGTRERSYAHRCGSTKAEPALAPRSASQTSRV
jgi:hypothetical protein